MEDIKYLKASVRCSGFVSLVVWNTLSVIITEDTASLDRLVPVMIGLVFASVVLYSFCVPLRDEQIASNGANLT